MTTNLRRSGFFGQIILFLPFSKLNVKKICILMFGCKGLNHMFLFTIQFSASENERRKGNLGTLCRSCKYNVLCACIVHLHWVMVILLLLKKLKTVRGQKLILVRIFFSMSYVVYYDEHIYLQGGLHCKYQGICFRNKLNYYWKYFTRLVQFNPVCCLFDF